MYDFFAQEQAGDVEQIAYKTYQEVFQNQDGDPICKQAVDFYMGLYIRFIKNLAYVHMPQGGLYIVDAVGLHKDGLCELFAQQFLNPGCSHQASSEYLSEHLKSIPVYLVSKPKLELHEAAIRYLMNYMRKREK